MLYPRNASQLKTNSIPMKTRLISLLAFVAIASLSNASPNRNGWGNWPGNPSHQESDYQRSNHWQGRPDVLIFEHAYQRGEALGLRIGDAIVDFSEIEMAHEDWNDAISSIRVKPGIEVWLYEHSGFRGRRIRITSSQDDMKYLDRRSGWNDQVSSLRIIREHQKTEHPKQNRRNERRERRRKEPAASLYEHSAYGGDSLQLFAGQSIPDLSPIPGGWNDSISSIHLSPGVVLELYEHAGFSGRKIVIDQSQGSLAHPRTGNGYGRSESWNDRISSIRVVSQ